MIIGMPISTFLATCIWPFVYIIAAIIVYFVMKRQDDMTDDSVHDHHHGEGGTNA